MDASRRRYRNRGEALTSWQCFVPLLCPFWLPITIILSIAFGDTVGEIVGSGYAAVLWALLGYIVVRTDSRQLAPTAESTVQ